MRVLLLSNKSAYTGAGFGGAESSMRLLAGSLAKRGHDVTYVSKAPMLAPWRKPRVQIVDDGVRLILLPTYRGKRISAVMALDSAMLRRQLREVLASWPVDVAYTFYEWENVQALLRSRQEASRPLVVMRMAGMRWSEELKRNPTLRPVVESIFNQVDAINFIHEGLRSMVGEAAAMHGLTFEPKATFTADIGTSAGISNGVRANARKTDTTFKIVMPARFSWYQKRQDLLIRAVSLLPRSLDVHVSFVGAGVRENEFRRLITDLELEGTVEIRPFMPQEGLWRVLAASDLFCMATEYEGLGKSILEAMALGVPVLVSNVRPLNQYIEDGANGYLVDNTPEQWAAKLADIINQKDQLPEVAATAMNYVSTHYAPEETVKVFEGAFEDLLNR